MTRRILAVDDMEFNRDHLRRVLEVEGHEVETAADGRSALERLRGKTFHLVITDLRMPDLSGLDLLSSLPPSESRWESSCSPPTATPPMLCAP